MVASLRVARLVSFEERCLHSCDKFFRRQLQFQAFTIGIGSDIEKTKQKFSADHCLKTTAAMSCLHRLSFVSTAGNEYDGSAGVLLKSQVERQWFQCSKCGYCTAVRSHFKNHERTHTGERPFRCSHCGQDFIRSDHLARHLRIHTGEKPYRCTHCGRAFIQSTSLIDHLRIHAGERPYRCDHCNKRFTKRTALTRHFRVHMNKNP
ncbi:uncharacterized protein LOC144106797 [Amblyomma americanum]